MKPIALTPTQQRRLMKLARQAGRAAEHILKFVLRDGFDYCEWQVRESRAADAESKRKGTIPNDQVQREARQIIDASRARKARPA